jgi:hypothetical protein
VEDLLQPEPVGKCSLKQAGRQVVGNNEAVQPVQANFQLRCPQSVFRPHWGSQGKASLEGVVEVEGSAASSLNWGFILF